MQYRAFLAVAALVAVVAAATADHCNAYSSCAVCVADVSCGWCSENVTYQNGVIPPIYQCAGAGPAFICGSVFSTGTCRVGYQCDNSTYQCVPTAPGQGQTMAQCESECSAVGKTFICNNATSTCDVAPAGQGTSLQVCESNCQSSHAPSSSSPSSSSPSSSSPSSSSPSSQSPSSHSPAPTPSPTYVCNASATPPVCVQAQPGQGSSLLVCDAACTPRPGPPSALVGLWRMFPIDTTTPVDEYDINFSASGTATIYTRNWTSTCQTTNIAQQVWLTQCTAPEQPTLKCLWETTLAMPETFQAMLACNYAGGNAPDTFAAGLAAANTSVMFMARCVPGNPACVFRAGPSAVRAAELPRAKAADPCENYSANCTYCLGAKGLKCGWCSVGVIDDETGQTLGQCAGFGSGQYSNWTCPGLYSTEACPRGWACIAENSTCVPTAPGDGNPSQAGCDAGCKAKPGPPSQLIGRWRGLRIDQAYPYGAYTVDINATSITMYFMSTVVLTGTVKNLAADVFFEIGNTTYTAYYTNDENEVVEYIELAVSGADLPAPASYNAAMQPPGQEFLLAKCAVSACKF